MGGSRPRRATYQATLDEVHQVALRALEALGWRVVSSGAESIVFHAPGAYWWTRFATVDGVVVEARFFSVGPTAAEVVLSSEVPGFILRRQLVDWGERSRVERRFLRELEKAVSATDEGPPPGVS